MKNIRILIIALLVSLASFGQRAMFHSQNITTATSGYDADAQAFFDVNTGLTTTQKSAVNQLVLDLKSASIWTKMKAIYPVVGGTEASHKWNLKDPRDLDAAFRLSFVGTYTHNSTGIVPTQAGDYINTFLNASTVLSVNNSHLSFYSASSEARLTSEIGAFDNSNILFDITARYTDGNFYGSIQNLTQSRSIFANGSALGFYIISRISSTDLSGYKNGTLGNQSTGTNTGGLPSLNVYLCARNDNGTPYTGGVVARTCSFASIGDGLTSTEVSAFNAAVQAYQTTLGR